MDTQGGNEPSWVDIEEPGLQDVSVGRRRRMQQSALEHSSLYDDYEEQQTIEQSYLEEDHQEQETFDPVSQWVEKTFTGESPAVETTNGGDSGVILMGVPPAGPKATRHKTNKKMPSLASQKKWLMMNKLGETDMVSLSKTELTQTLGIQLRDLRLLDPLLVTSYPSAILCRERSLVVNLEYVKMIVGLEKCYITNLEDENAQEFISQLKRRLEYLSTHNGSMEKKVDDSVNRSFEDLPFELRVVEAALDIVLKYMEALTSDLEASAHPALDALTSKVETDNLERVRRVKNRMVRLTTRVETLREVLEKFLDDDSDMRDMNLTAREAREAQEKILDAIKHGNQPFDMPVTMQSGELKPPETPHSTLTYDSDEEEEEAIEVVEQLLETYFMQADNTWNKLQTLTEYIDDTEDYVNIQLDSQRNQLIRLDLILTCLSASVALITAVTSLFAMNVSLSPNSSGGPYSWFVIISCCSAGGAIFLFVSVMAYSRYKRLI
jgi:magnesium transporter